MHKKWAGDLPAHFFIGWYLYLELGVSLMGETIISIQNRNVVSLLSSGAMRQ